MVGSANKSHGRSLNLPYLIVVKNKSLFFGLRSLLSVYLVLEELEKNPHRSIAHYTAMLA